MICSSWYALSLIIHIKIIMGKYSEQESHAQGKRVEKWRINNVYYKYSCIIQPRCERVNVNSTVSIAILFCLLYMEFVTVINSC